MADVTRIITVEMTKVFKDAKEGDQTDFGTKIDLTLNGILCHCFDQIKITKIDDIVSKSKPKLTKRERMFCELITDGYIARDYSQKLYWYNSKPMKGGTNWYNESQYVCIDLLNVPFMFIQWKDDEPWAVSSLFELEVEE